MASIALVGSSRAGAGVLLGTFNSQVFVDGRLVAVVGTQVAPHGRAPHNAARVAQGSSTVFVGNRPVARVGDLASCGDSISGGSSVNCG